MNEVVRNSVQVYHDRLARLPVRESEVLAGFLVWEGDYDPNLLGYMADKIGRPKFEVPK